MSYLATFLLVTCNQAHAMTKTEVKSFITKAAVSRGIDPDLAIAIAMTESSLNPRAIGALGEVGVFQLRPEYHRVVKGNPKQNILAGIEYLADLKTKLEPVYGESWFVFFNYGPNSKLKNAKATRYYTKVMSKLGQIKSTRYLAKE